MTVMASGTPEIGQRMRKLTDELTYAMGRDFDFGTVELPKPDLVILSVCAIAPWRGAIPDGTSFKRSQGEFWSTFNVDFAAFESGDPRKRLEALAAALRGAVAQVPGSRIPDDIKSRFYSALAAAVELLLSEPERL